MKSIQWFFGLLTVIFLSGCATQVPPSGGPVDTTPPVPQSYHPANGTVRYNGEKIVIKFDEFIELKNLNSQLVVSPAMPDQPEVEVRGKKLVIQPPDSLSENTTYTIFLGNAVVNFKEGLAVPHFQYVFSTGDALDSLQITGQVKSAFDLKEEEGVLVMLYRDTRDSVPYFKKPYYLAKTYDDGRFLLSNLSEGKYLIFALKDMNSNYIYDQPSEEIAFLDTLVVPAAAGPADDSLNLIHPVNVKLFLFKEIPARQALMSSKVISPKKMVFTFRRPAQNIDIQLLDTSFSSWYYPVFNAGRDSLTVWVTRYPGDTVNMVVKENEMPLDTLKMIFKKAAKKKNLTRRQKRKMNLNSDTVKVIKPAPRLKIVSNAQKGTVDFFGRPVLEFSSPLKVIRPGKITLYKKTDTIFKKIPVKVIEPENRAADRVVIDAALEEETIYRLWITDSAFVDLFGISNDTLQWAFKTTKSRNYGSFKLIVETSIKGPLLIQLLDKDDHILQQEYLKDSVINYPWLRPGDYKIKVVADRNRNGKWDTGDYLKKQQPERVYFLGEAVKIRANWDVEKRWILK